mgnify:CR=1 FL=1
MGLRFIEIQKVDCIKVSEKDIIMAMSALLSSCVVESGIAAISVPQRQCAGWYRKRGIVRSKMRKEFCSSACNFSVFSKRANHAFKTLSVIVSRQEITWNKRMTPHDLCVRTRHCVRIEVAQTRPRRAMGQI